MTGLATEKKEQKSWLAALAQRKPTVETLSGQSVTRVRSWRGWAENSRGFRRQNAGAGTEKKHPQSKRLIPHPFDLDLLVVVESDLFFVVDLWVQTRF